MQKKHITWLYKPCWQANFEGLRMAGWPLYVLLTLMKPLKPQLLRLKSKPKSITFTGESTDGVKKSTFSGFKSRCKTPGHSGGSHTNVYNLGKQSGGFESLPLPKKRNLFHTKRKESAPGPPNNFSRASPHLQALYTDTASCFLGSFWTLAISFFIGSLLIEHNTTNRRSCHFQNLLTIYLHHTLKIEKGLCTLCKS